MAERNKISSFTVFSSFLLISVVYRAHLTFALSHKGHSMFGNSQISCIVLGSITDFLVGFFIATLFLFTKFCFDLIGRHKRLIKFVNFIEVTFLTLLFCFVAIIYTIYSELFVLLSSGLTISILVSFFDFNHYDSLDFLLEYVDSTDCVIVVSLILTGIFVKFLSLQRRKKVCTYLFLPCVLFCLLMALLFYSVSNLPRAFFQHNEVIFKNPLVFMVQDWFRSQHNIYINNKALPGQQQMQSVRLIDSAFINSQNKPIKHQPLIAENKPWNVVLIILESVGANYIFDSVDKTIPMHFLQDLAKKGWWFRDNYSSGNMSSLGGFGLITGLYASPDTMHSDRRADTIIPNFAAWLGPQYNSFFVTPQNSGFYFPEGVFKNSGFKHFYDSQSAELKTSKKYNMAWVGENDGMAFFINRLEHAKPPFFATYWSSAAHWPYYDYGDRYHLLSNNQREKSRYINNVYMLDQEIKQVYETLKKEDRLKDTIIVIVGDHGEGFNDLHKEHGHGSSLYEEQIKVPLIFYQPKLFKPRTVDYPTSSIDVLPTILTAINKPFNIEMLQGESLFSQSPSRKYIFIYGVENEIAAIDLNHLKMKISFASGKCDSFDLHQDPYELSPLPCIDKEKENAIIKYHNYQISMLNWYNNSLLKKAQKI